MDLGGVREGDLGEALSKGVTVGMAPFYVYRASFFFYLAVVRHPGAKEPKSYVVKPGILKKEEKNYRKVIFIFLIKKNEAKKNVFMFKIKTTI